MSRTYKDRPTKIQHPKASYSFDKSDQPKIAKKEDDSWHWTGTTPSWWTSLVFHKPQRRWYKVLEKRVLLEIYIGDFDFIDTKNKPVIYYW